MEDLSRLFKSVSRTDTEFSEAVAVVKANSNGGMWLTGSYLYRLLASYLYPQGMDLRYWRFSTPMDFMVETFVELHISDHWQRRSFPDGRHTLYRGKRDKSRAIHIVPLSTVDSVVARQLPVSIESYLATTPLTIQSVVYDLYQHQVFGEVGKQALEERTVRLYDAQSAARYAERKGKPLAVCVREKAEVLGFTPVLP